MESAMEDLPANSMTTTSTALPSSRMASINARRRADGCWGFLDAAFFLLGAALVFLGAALFFVGAAWSFFGAAFFFFGAALGFLDAAGFLGFAAGFLGAALGFPVAALVCLGLAMESSSVRVGYKRSVYSIYVG